jgi:hypothetical protein
VADGFRVLVCSLRFSLCPLVAAATGAAARDGKMEVFTSYGGLLMSLKGEPAHLSKIELDMRMYLLIKKVE